MSVHWIFVFYVPVFRISSVMVTFDRQLYNWRGLQCLLDVGDVSIKICNVCQAPLVFNYISAEGISKVNNVEDSKTSNFINTVFGISKR